MTSLLNATDTVVVMVDLQERLVPAIQNSGRIIERTRLLALAARELLIPVIATTQYAKGLGPIVAGIAELLASPPIDKTSFSCLGSPGFAAAFAQSGRKTVLLCGVEAHICVLQTGLDFRAAGHAVHVVTDAAGSRDPENERLGFNRLASGGATLSSTEMAIYELLRDSSSPAFRKLLPHLK